MQKKHNQQSTVMEEAINIDMNQRHSVVYGINH